jgi:Asp/Glu/hydantoin racemase
MHLLAFTPIAVDADELRRRQDRYDQLAPTTVTVELRNIGRVAPRALESESDIRSSENALEAAFRNADPEGFDGFLPDCVLDPCAEVAGRFARPLYGLTRLTASFYASQGRRLGALARNDSIAQELDRRLAFYGLAADATHVLGLGVHDIADTEVWGRAVIEHAARLSCSVAINACSAVDLTDPPNRPLVVDPTATALSLLGISVALETLV